MKLESEIRGFLNREINKENRIPTLVTIASAQVRLTAAIERKRIAFEKAIEPLIELDVEAGEKIRELASRTTE